MWDFINMRSLDCPTQNQCGFSKKHLSFGILFTKNKDNVTLHNVDKTLK